VAAADGPAPGGEVDLADRPGTPLLVELLSSRPLELDRPALLRAFDRWTGKVGVPEGAPGFVVFHGDFVGDYADAQGVPAQTCLLTPEATGDDERLQRSLGHTYGWPAAREVVSRCRHALLLASVMGGTLPPARRLALLTGALRAVLDVLPVEALHWASTERVVEPRAFLEAAGNDVALFEGPMNVRLFRVDDGRVPGETLMDTLGLRTFGVPDLQLHYVASGPGVEGGLEPGRVAALLYDTARSLFERGDVQAGHTVQGLVGEERWACRHERALAAPGRLVLDIDPGRHGPPRGR
jgi:hypothetical protein